MPYKVKRKAGSKSEITCKLLFSSSDITIVVTSLCVCDFEEVRRQGPHKGALTVFDVWGERCPRKGFG